MVNAGNRMMIHDVFHHPSTSNRCYSLKCVDWHFLEKCFNNLPAPRRCFGALCRAVKSGLKIRRQKCFFVLAKFNKWWLYFLHRLWAMSWHGSSWAHWTGSNAALLPGTESAVEKQRPPVELAGITANTLRSPIYIYSHSSSGGAIEINSYVHIHTYNIMIFIRLYIIYLLFVSQCPMSECTA